MRILFLLAAWFPMIALGADVVVSEFQNNSLAGWDTHEFEGETRYTLVENDGRTVLQAVSNQAASGLIKRIPIDLRKTPYLHWRWKVEKLPVIDNERTKKGDDFAARVYVVISGGIFFWRTLALNYVWSANQPRGLDWPNPFTSNAHMVSVRGKEDPTGVWFEETRNVREDLRRYFGDDIDQIDGIALMTDTDNSKGSAVAYYANIRFSSE